MNFLNCVSILIYQLKLSFNCMSKGFPALAKIPWRVDKSKDYNNFPMWPLTKKSGKFLTIKLAFIWRHQNYIFKIRKIRQDMTTWAYCIQKKYLKTWVVVLKLVPSSFLCVTKPKVQWVHLEGALLIFHLGNLLRIGCVIYSFERSWKYFNFSLLEVYLQIWFWFINHYLYLSVSYQLFIKLYSKLATSVLNKLDC